MRRSPCRTHARGGGPDERPHESRRGLPGRRAVLRDGGLSAVVWTVRGHLAGLGRGASAGLVTGLQEEKMAARNGASTEAGQRRGGCPGSEGCLRIGGACPVKEEEKQPDEWARWKFAEEGGWMRGHRGAPTATSRGAGS